MSTNIQADNFEREKIQNGVYSRIQLMYINTVCSDGCVHTYINVQKEAYKDSYQTDKTATLQRTWDLVVRVATKKICLPFFPRLNSYITVAYQSAV